MCWRHAKKGEEKMRSLPFTALYISILMKSQSSLSNAFDVVVLKTGTRKRSEFTEETTKRK